MQRMLRKIAVAALCVTFLAGASVVEAPAPQVHVTDADTIRLAGIKVRFDGINSPERGHPAYVPGRTFLSRVVRSADSVRCELTGAMAQDRHVGTCYLVSDSGEVNMLSLVVSAGFARDCPRFSGGRYAEFETDASRALPFAGFCEVR